MLALLGFPKPTVAMVNGHAIAGGLVMVLACDYRLGARGDYRVGLNEVAIGASFPHVAFEIVAPAPGARPRRELLLGAALYPASQALRLGIVDELFPADTLRPTPCCAAPRAWARFRATPTRTPRRRWWRRRSRASSPRRRPKPSAPPRSGRPTRAAPRAQRQREKLGIRPR